MLPKKKMKEKPPRKFLKRNATGDFIYPGNCSAGACGDEAACFSLSQNTYTCVCPHDSSTPTPDFKCPNRRIVPLMPKPIPNIIPPYSGPADNSTPKIITSTAQSFHPQVESLSITYVVGVCLVAIVPFLVFIALCGYTRFRKQRRFDEEKPAESNATSPISLSKGLLDAGRYATNPQYMGTLPDGHAAASLSLPSLPRHSVTFHHVIGEGCFGKVFKGTLQLDTDTFETVAVKVLKESATKEAEEDFMREVEIMASFQHSNILSLLGVVFKEVGKSPWMVFEFMPHGDLTEVLRGNSKTFWKPDANCPLLSRDSLLSIATQIACGMHYLAGQHFVHRDLACRNCLVGYNLTVKIADFGMSRDVYTCDYYKIGGSRLLPVRWMSPESITYGRFTLESDVWSFGVILWEIYSFGKQPYFGHSNDEVVKLILQGILLNPPEDCPPMVVDLMFSCWKIEPKERTNFDSIHRSLVVLNEQIQPFPRPPPFTVLPPPAIPELPETEVEDYLRPQPNPPHEYITPLPD